MIWHRLSEQNPVEWTGGPTPPPIKVDKGPLAPAGDTEGDVYLWLVRQATLRLKDVQDHILTGKPTVSELAYKYTAEKSTISAWINKTRKKAAKISGTGRGGRFRSAVKSLDVPRPEPFSQRSLEIPRGVIFFASGAQGSPGDIEGVARIARHHRGVGIGIEIGACDQACIDALHHVSRRPVPLFVDSGAYGEFTRKIPIPDEEWVAKLGKYQALASTFGDRANLVAPDKIGSQAETAGRLHKFGHLLRTSSRKYGAWILLVAHKGHRPRHLFWEDMRGILANLGIPENKIVAALPLKKKAMSLADVKVFAKHFKGEVGRYHLLGVSPLNRSPGFRRLLEAIWEWSPEATITCDASTIVKGLRGDPVLLGVVPRVYTHAQDIVRYDIMLEAFQRSWRGGETMEGWLESGWGEKLVPEYHDEMIYVDDWLPRRYRMILADALVRRSRCRGDPLYRHFGAQEYKKLVDSPGEFLTSPVWEERGHRFLWWEDPEISAWIDDQWVRYMGTWFSARVKRDALTMAWHARELAIAELAFG